MFRLIPWRDELLAGMLGADLIGFHTFDDVRHFLNAATRLLPVTTSANILTNGERSVVIESLPMGIDDKKYASLPLEKNVQTRAEIITEPFERCNTATPIDSPHSRQHY